MKTSTAATLALALGLSALAAPKDARGETPPAAEAPRQTVSSKPKIESSAVSGTSIQRIRATIAIDAPIDRVRAVVFDYGRYPEFMPMYVKPTGVVWTTPAGLRLVHMQVGGVVSLWMRVEIGPARIVGAVETYEGRLVQGNIKAFRPRWELEALSPDRTRLTVDSFLDPDLSLVPSGLINSGARDGMRDAIVALKARVEASR
jgi:ribosome-associated toxin RatA of RatAB toxin-antitoxin module